MHIQLPERQYSAMGWSGVTPEPFTLPLGNNLESVNLCPRMSSTEKYLRRLFPEDRNEVQARRILDRLHRRHGDILRRATHS